MTDDSNDDPLGIDEDLANEIETQTAPERNNNEKDGDQEEIFYPSVQEVIEIHDDIIEDGEGEPGLENRGDIEYAIDAIQGGPLGRGGPETLHEKAFQLMRLIAANHPFVDGNKRTALASTVYFYFWNGYDLEYQEELESMLILISIREDFIDPEVAVEYLADITEELDFDDIIEELIGDLEFLEEMAENIEQGFEADLEDRPGDLYTSEE